MTYGVRQVLWRTNISYLAELTPTVSFCFAFAKAKRNKTVGVKFARHSTLAGSLKEGVCRMIAA
jgi:hypothetical protein